VREAVYQRIIRYDAEHGLFLLFDSKVYQPLAASSSNWVTERPLPFGSKFRPGQKVRFTVERSFIRGEELLVKGLAGRLNTWGQRLDPRRRCLFSVHAAAAGVAPHLYAEIWKPVKVKPEGHYHYSC
jgi:hypothetical protein